MKPDLSILVVTYNTKTFVEKCIQSVLNYSGPYKIEILVVDNNSSDETSELIKTKYPEVKLIINQYNYGFAIGMNQAYRMSSGRFVMTFNPDAEIYNPSIDAAICFLDNNSDVGLLGMLTEDSNGVIEVPHHEFHLIEKVYTFNLLFRKRAYNIKKVDKVMEVQWLWGTSIFARRESLGQNFFIEDNFLFWEEYWLCKKVKQKGFKINILLNYCMLHHISASFKADFEKLELIRILSDVNGHSAKLNEYGYFKTYLSYLIKVIDHSSMVILLRLLILIKKKNKQERQLSYINHVAHLKSHVKLILSGKRYQKKFQNYAIKKLNKGKTPSYPPKFFPQ